jgi:ABC-2 type transport system permease protein
MELSRICLVARREWTTRIQQRSFRIVTAIQILLVVLGACVPTIIARFSGDGGSTAHIVVVDEASAQAAQRLAPYFAATGDVAGADRIVIDPAPASADEARQWVNDGKVDGALIVSRDQNNDLAFVLETKKGDSSTATQQVNAAAAALSVQDRLAQAGVSQQAFAAATAPPSFTIQATNAKEASDTANDSARYGVGFAFTILMFMAIMLYGQWVAQGVVEEKSSRIMEIMVNAATPRDLLFGKVIGIALAGFTQLVPMMIAGGITFAAQPRIADALNVTNSNITEIDFSAISISAIGSFAVFFLIGFTLYASLFASVGSLVSRQEEVSQAVSPLTTVMMVGYLGALVTVSSPDSDFAKAISIFPLTAPFSMVMRIVVGHPAAWEIGLSIGLLVATAIAGVLFAARVYRVGVLMYGQKPSWRAVFNPNAVRAAR